MLEMENIIATYLAFREGERGRRLRGSADGAHLKVSLGMSADALFSWGQCLICNTAEIWKEKYWHVEKDHTSENI